MGPNTNTNASSNSNVDSNVTFDASDDVPVRPAPATTPAPMAGRPPLPLSNTAPRSINGLTPPVRMPRNVVSGPAALEVNSSMRPMSSINSKLNPHYEDPSRPPDSLRRCGSSVHTTSFIDTRQAWSNLDVSSYLSNPRAYSNASNMAQAYADQPTIEKALAILERASISLRCHRYQEALRFYVEGAYAMTNVAETQINGKIYNLLTSKGIELLNWCGTLCAWLEGRIQDNGRDPRPGNHKVGIPFDWNENWSTGHFDIDNLAELEDEVMKRWYTPVTCLRPRDFSITGHVLHCMEINRPPKIMICITMYNESPSQLKSTLHKICNNIKYLASEGHVAGYERDEVWKDVLVCIIADGRANINEKTLEYLESVGLYDEDVLTICSAGLDTQCHVFEHTLQLTLNGMSFLPLQTMFCLKERKHSKLDSHAWFFNAFARQINPKYTFLLDVGTMPSKNSLASVLQAFETNKQIGGACGQLTVDAPYRNMCNWVVAAQHFEYKISNLLDKACESCFGFISVLPGAFCAYRYKAIQGEPLEAYFQTRNVELDILGPFVGNMYLAEDRVLCFELLAKRECSWTMHYVKEAIARTDVPEDLIGLLNQRKRWLNGSFFATLFALWNWKRLYTHSNHSVARKLALSVYYVFQLVSTVFTWFLPANLFVTLYFVVFQAFQQNRWQFLNTKSFDKSVLDFPVYFYNIGYPCMMLVLLMVSLGNTPKHMRLFYYFVASLLGIIMMACTMITIGIFFAGDLDAAQIWTAVFVVGTYFISAAVYGELHHVLMSFLQFTAMVPCFVNIFTIYSFCNLQDLSWGTKGDHGDGGGGCGGGDTKNLILAMEEEIVNPLDGPDPNANHHGYEFQELLLRRKATEERQKELDERRDSVKSNFEAFRTNLLILWVFSNVAMALYCEFFMTAQHYLPIIALFTALLNGFRLVGCLGHWVYVTFNLSRSMCFNNLNYIAQDELDDDEVGHYVNLSQDRELFEAEQQYDSGGVYFSNNGAYSNTLQ